MTYISDDGEVVDTSDWEYPPTSGTRIVHAWRLRRRKATRCDLGRQQCYSDNVLYVRIQHAEQTFRSARREQTLVVPMRDAEWDDQDVMDAMHYSIGTRPLT